MQRRLGPTIFGLNGIFQTILDILKSLFKNYFFNVSPIFYFYIIIIFIIFYFKFIFIYFYSFDFFMIMFYNFNYNIFLILNINIINQLLLICLGFFTYNKYSFISIYRIIIQIISFEFLNSFLILCLVIFTKISTIFDYLFENYSINLLILFFYLC